MEYSDISYNYGKLKVFIKDKHMKNLFDVIKTQRIILYYPLERMNIWRILPRNIGRILKNYRLIF